MYISCVQNTVRYLASSKAKGRAVEAPQNYSLFVQLSFKYHCYEQLQSSRVCAHMHNLVKVPNGQKFSSLGTYVVHDFD